MENDVRFDYEAALRRLEELSVKVGDPGTGLDAIQGYMTESRTLVERCREYLRSLRPDE